MATVAASSGAGEHNMGAHGFPWLTRVLSYLLAVLVLRPLAYLVDKFGYTDRLWRAIGRRIRRDVIDGSDFGDYRPTDKDVLVCTFPKCGTNWVMQIAHQIATRGSGNFTHIHAVVPWPDFTKQSLIIPLSDKSPQQSSPTGLRVIKTHLEWDRIPYSEDARYICILRDPKDAFVSNYHFVRDIFFGTLMPPVSVWLKLFCSNGFPFVWPEHVHGYWQARELPNVMILTFEEIKADMSAVITRIAHFMGVELTVDEFAKVCKKSSFGYMQQISDRFKPPALTPLAAVDRKMIRRGASGASDELLTAEQQAAIDAYCKESLTTLGSDLPYETFWGKTNESEIN